MGWKDMFESEEEAVETQQTAVSSAVVQSAGIALFEPRTFDEATEIADKLKAGNATAVNLHRLSKDYAQRTIDFLTGVVYAEDGRIEKVGHNLILCSPASVKLSGTIDLNRTAE